MTKVPKLTTREEMVAFSAVEDVAKSTMGGVVVALIRQGATLSVRTIRTELELRASMGDALAEGALQFMASLPQPSE